MKTSMFEKLQILVTRYKELELILNNPNIFSNQKKFLLLSKEYGQLSIIIKYFKRWQFIKNNISDTEILLKDDEICDIARDDLRKLNSDRLVLEKKIQSLFISLFKQKNKDVEKIVSYCFLEIRAGTGGNEAALFAGELFRMYIRYAERSRWKVNIINTTHGEQGGYKEVIIKIIHIDAYKSLKFESGGHRVQRIPNTESQGRIHTSSCTVAVIPEIPHMELPKINHSDLRIDTFRSSGAGGQHVNTTDSAIRITHIPSGIIVGCQNERSQHKNKSRALEVLKTRLYAIELKRKQQESSSTRKNLLGTGERSDRIRTYNFHQNRITDHRINLTIYCLNEVMEGNLDILIHSLLNKCEIN